ncbi:MAG: PKD domain-containing protein [Bacteroidia bacterium]|nr:PKD domain-containing protein [Bacteroidia bacterium]
MAPTPTHVYNTPGTYYVTLIAQNGTGCTDSVVTTIPVVAAATPQPAFYVSNNIGCPPLPVTFHNQSLMTDSTTQFTWSLGNGLSTSNSEPTYVYHVPGTYSVTLTAVNGGVCSASATLPGIVQVNVGTPPPVVELKSASVIDGSSVELTWGNLAIQNLEAYKVYRFNRAFSVFDLIYTDSNPGNTSLNATSTYVDTLLNTVSETYTYVVQAMNECLAEPDLSLHTPHTTINLNAAIVDNAVHLDWNLYDGCSVSRYQVFRQDHQTGSFNLIAELGNSTYSFIDSTIYCGMLAAYRIKATDLCNEGFEAWSDVEAIDAPGILANQKVDIIRSTVNDDNYVFTEWAPPVLAPQLVTNFELYRSYDMQNWSLLTTLPPTETNYSDFSTQVKSQNYYYKIKVNNLCNLETTEGDPGSSILLTGAIDDENRTHLKWTPYKDWDTGVDYYVIERVDLNGNWQPIQVVDGSVNDYIDR